MVKIAGELVWSVGDRCACWFRQAEHGQWLAMVDRPVLTPGSPQMNLPHLG